MSAVIELEHLKPISLESDDEITYFEMIVKSYTASYFNMADVPLLEIYAKTLKELNILYAALALAGSPAAEKNKMYEKTSRLIDTKVKCLTRVGSSLRINPQQRRAAGTTRQDSPEDVGREVKAGERDGITHKKIWKD